MPDPIKAADTTPAPAPVPQASASPGTVVPAAAPIDKGAGKPPSDQTVPPVKDETTPAPDTLVAGAPESYADFTWPADLPFSKEILDTFTPIFKEANMSQDQAQKFIDQQAKTAQASLAAQAKEYTDQVALWVTQTKADKEIGGANYEKSVQTAHIGLAKFASPAYLTLLKDSGLDQHPETIRTFNKIGQLLKEDKPDFNHRPANPQQSPEDRLYPNDPVKAAKS